MDFLFLPPVYLLTLAVSAIVTGLTFDYINQKPFIMASAGLFTIFTVSQLVFRILENSMPERLVGQLIYYLLFLAIVFITRKAKDVVLGGRVV